MSTPIVVVGIGADGWAGLGEAARAAVLEADVLVGGERHLALVPDGPAERWAWPSPIGPLVDEIVANGQRRVCVLASGDPMLHGIGATLARRVGPERLVVHPHASAFALACARLGWPAAEVMLVSAVGRPVDIVAAHLQPGRRLIVYGAMAPAIAQALDDRGYGPSRLVTLEELGGPHERIAEGAEATHALHCVAIECRPEPGIPLLPRTPGLPDDAYESDGQLTKREIRAVTLAALAPAPGQLLWDVGAGSGSIAIEWLRAEPTARAIAIEIRPDRAERIARNAKRLGVPHLTVVTSLDGLEPPDAVFVGGGLAANLERCRATGARLVANAVTLEGEQLLAAAHAQHGGRLIRLAVCHAEPLGAHTGWRPQRPVTQWALP